MVSFIIMGCIVMSYFLMATTTILKSLSALIDTMMDMLEVWAILLLGGLGIGAIELIVAIFGGSFWSIVGAVAVIVVVCIFLGGILSIIGSILLFLFEIAIQIASIVLGLVDAALEQLGNWSELGLKYFLGTINKHIVLS